MEFLALVLLCVCSRFAAADEDERLPNKCEVCKFLTVELQEALEKTGRSKEVLEVGEVLDSGRRRRKIKYNTSETRLTEALDDICERFLQYSVHAERPGSLRYSKGSSQTMTTLKNLVNKGVKVDLGMPYELWDEPTVEVADMKKQCETMLEQYEEVVEDWYFHHQDQRLEDFLCEDHVLEASERDCLKEVWRDDRRLEEEEEAGRTEGRAEGRAEGQSEGRAEGRAEGQSEGRTEGRTEGQSEGRTHDAGEL
uniref:Canopy FGF signaling regulator 4 n=1 Tax=Kryptolebias marmoratus TaxID=37003 RepID=A0A3Q3FKH4_KRYMA